MMVKDYLWQFCHAEYGVGSSVIDQLLTSSLHSTWPCR